MKVMAKVTISGCVYEEWKAFYDSYQADRARFIKDETVLQQGDHAAGLHVLHPDQAGAGGGVARVPGIRARGGLQGAARVVVVLVVRT